MTEKEYNAARRKIVTDYMQDEQRIIAQKKQNGTFGKNPDQDFDLFLKMNLEMRRKLKKLEKQYMSQPFHSPVYDKN